MPGRVAVVGLVGLLAACSFRAGAAPAADGSASDATMLDTGGGSGSDCFGKGLVNVCPDTLPTQPVTLSAGTLNTDTSPLCKPFTSSTNTVACLVAGTDVSLSSGTVIVTGSRPLVILATAGTIHISGSGEIDASSHVGSGDGPNADPAACMNPVAPSFATTGGGGAGGSFGGSGGNGGNGADNTTTAGSAASASAPTALRGGCAGGSGATTTAQAGSGGHGGGAAYLLAKTLVQLDGTATINASGAAGAAGSLSSSGGGGGGAGGMIGLEAPMITISGGAVVFANGGGGGQASGSTTGGGTGADSSGPGSQGSGGSGVSTNGGVGGGGAYAGSGAGGGGNGIDDGTGGLGGGGGGGGGAGVVVMIPLQTFPTTVVAPPPS